MKPQCIGSQNSLPMLIFERPSKNAELNLSPNIISSTPQATSVCLSMYGTVS